MKKELIVVASLIALFIIGSFLFVPKNYLTGNAISSINFPTDCSEANIQSLWDSIFLESSTGIQFVFNDTNSTNNKCDNFLAAKTVSNNESYLLWSIEEDPTLLYHSWIVAKKTQFNSSIYNYSSLISSVMMESFSARTNLLATLSSPSSASNRSPSLSTSQDAQSDFSSVFKNTIVAGNFISYLNEFSFSESENYSSEGKNFTRSLSGYVTKNLTDRTLAFEILQFNPATCAPNWTRQESICYSNDTKVVFYNDSNNCNNLTGKPVSLVSDCDNNSNGVIGELSASQNSLNLSVYVAGSLFNSSFNYSNSSSNRLVEIKNNGKTVLSFMYGFNDPLVLNNITIKLNSNSSAFGYILVNGLNEDKSVIFDKKNSSSTQVCVRDEYVSSVSDISDYCEDDNEYLISCPGTSKGYGCNISGNYFNVSGLEHSAVKEMILTQNITACVQNWSCTAWSNCTNLIKTRSCNDTARCNNVTGRPNLTESCVPAEVVTPACIPQWSCTEWSPEKCNGKNQTRSCTDLNKCNSNANKPAETQACSSSLKKYLLWATIILFVLLIGTAIYFLISRYSGKKEAPSGDAPKKDNPLIPINTSLPNQTSVPVNTPLQNQSPVLPALPANVPPEIPDVK